MDLRDPSFQEPWVRLYKLDPTFYLDPGSFATNHLTGIHQLQVDLTAELKRHEPETWVDLTNRYLLRLRSAGQTLITGILSDKRLYAVQWEDGQTVSTEAWDVLDLPRVVCVQRVAVWFLSANDAGSLWEEYAHPMVFPENEQTRKPFTTAAGGFWRRDRFGWKYGQH